MFPSLPTDHIYKFVCVGGLVLLVASFIGMNSVHNKQIELPSQANRETLEWAEMHLALNPKIFEDREGLELLQSVRSSINKRIEGEVKILGKQRDYLYIMFLIGNLMFFVGYVFWTRHQDKLDKIVRLESTKASRQYTQCQSCSTNLQFIEINAGKIYCTQCHNGYSFTEPNLTLDVMEKRVREKMKSNGCTKADTEKQVKKIIRLYRWNFEFKWN